MPAADIDRLLQPFERSAPSRTGHRDGIGLGLSIVTAIAKAHGAELVIHPGERGGLRVEVRFRALPRVAAPDDHGGEGASRHALSDPTIA